MYLVRRMKWEKHKDAGQGEEVDCEIVDFFLGDVLYKFLFVFKESRNILERGIRHSAGH